MKLKDNRIKIFLVALIFLGLLSGLLWKLKDGVVCTFGLRCYISLTNIKYEYWMNKAIQTNNINLCNNVEGTDEGDIEYSKEGAVYNCRMSYIIKTDDVNYCRSLDSKDRNVCLKGLAKRLSNTNLCQELSEPGDKGFELRMINTCEDNIKNNHHNDLITY